VLLTRDTSLAVALKALLGEGDRVSELESAKGWRTLNGSPIDAVVVDLPPALRKAAVEGLERRFSGRLVVLLDPDEDLATTVNRQLCSVLHRPFGMSELWTLLVASAPDATHNGPPEPPQAGERHDAGVSPEVEPRASGGPQAPPARPDRQAPRALEPAWRWRVRRFQHAPEPAQPGELTEPMPRVGVEGNGVLPAAAEALPAPEEAPASAPAPDPVPAAASGGPAPAPEEAPASAPAPEPVPAAASGGPAPAPEEAPASAPAPEPVPAAASGGPAPAAVDEQVTSLMDTAMWDEANEAPQAVATRLARRLRLDVVALLLDNGRGLLETAGGVGLAPTERRLQVEYGHDVLRELFRVGVGLVDDTKRVQSILSGIPVGEADTLMMVPLVHEGHGFGVLLAGRHRRWPSRPDSEFTESEIEALMDFAEDVGPALRSAILLRRLKGQLNLAEGL
jgi:hypothetical protein